jgi:UDP-glucose 4-epimerase
MMVMVNKTKILVTGGAGFIGHHLSNELYKMGYEVHVWDNLSVGKKERLSDGILFKQIDLIYDELPYFDFDIVYHLASPTSVPESIVNPEKYEKGCYDITKRIVDSCIENKVKQMFFSSTSAVYGNTDEFPTKETSKLNPLSPYAKYKLDAENYIDYVQEYTETKFTICRFFNVFGEEQHNQGSYAPAVAIFLKQYHNSEPITVTGDGLQTRDYIYVKDIVSFLIGGIGQEKYKKEIFNLGFGKDLTIKSIAEVFGSEIRYIEERDEPKKSLSDISKAGNIHEWKPNVSVIEWIKSEITSGQ